ncbi:mechanosensitive ion channel family protein, partial [Helicobacter pylori]|uniref:mechanosensitive ion channel family protein n=1 Tax=Helicobacter pylori TaxID=210 RepID=UPI0005B2FDD7
VKDVLANFFASVILLLDNSFSQGDWIVCGEVEGTGVEMGLRRTTIRAFDNALLSVPNSELAGKPIRNWSR